MAAVTPLDPPDLGFYAKQLRVRGVVVKAHAVVPDEALLEAGRRIERLLGRCPGVSANLEAAGAELHVIGRDQQVTDLPMYRHLAGVPFAGDQTMDQRGRGYGGLHACCDEDGLLRLPTARHRDHRDVCAHELAHAVLSFGLDPELRALVRARWEAVVAEGRWATAYAETNEHELFAELTMWYVGSRGDHGRLSPPPADGPDGLRAHDPASFELLDDIYSGRRAPRALRWEVLQPVAATRSTAGEHPTDVVFHNRTAEVLELLWLDYEGGLVPYGPVSPAGVRAQATYATHPWVVRTRDRRELGRYVPGPEPAKVVLEGGPSARNRPDRSG